MTHSAEAQGQGLRLAKFWLMQPEPLKTGPGADLCSRRCLRSRRRWGGGHSRLELWGKREASTGRLKPGARGGVEEGSRGSGTWAEDRALGSAGRSAGPGRGAEKEQQRGRAGALGERMEKSRGQPRGMRHRGPHSRSKIKQPRSFWSPSMSKHLSRPLWRMSHSEGALRTGCPHS